MNFSERNGYLDVDDAIVREDLTDVQRTGIWNILKICAWDKWQVSGYIETTERQDINAFVRILWVDFFKSDLDDLPRFQHNGTREGAYEIIKDYFFYEPWNIALDFLEFTSKNLGVLFSENCRNAINEILERENSAYRMVDKEIVEITDKQEILAIEEGLSIQVPSIKNHLQRALELLSDRESRDYRNSIKEAISAVEASCRQVVKDDKATLGQALKKVDDLHPALLKAFSSLYGYTSDEDGIRHALTEDSNVNYEDAKFMLVACAAFTTFLEAKRVRSTEIV